MKLRFTACTWIPEKYKVNITYRPAQAYMATCRRLVITNVKNLFILVAQTTWFGAEQHLDLRPPTLHTSIDPHRLANQIASATYVLVFQYMYHQWLVDIGNKNDGIRITSVVNCWRPPILIGPSSLAYRLHPPTQRSLVGHTIPHVKPNGLSLKIVFAAP
jgi:hypothetical protein